METIKNAIGLGGKTDTTQAGQEPVSGQQGQGTATQPYDSGNQQEDSSLAGLSAQETNANTMADTTSSNPSGTEAPLMDGSTERDLQAPVTSTAPPSGGATNESTLGNTSRYDGGADESTTHSREGISQFPVASQTTFSNDVGSPKIGSSDWFQTAAPSTTSTSERKDAVSRDDRSLPSRDRALGSEDQTGGVPDATNTSAAAGTAAPTSANSNEPSQSDSHKQAAKDAAGLSSVTPKQARSMENPSAIPVAGGQTLGSAAGEERKQAKAEGRDYEAELADSGLSSGGDGLTGGRSREPDMMARGSTNASTHASNDDTTDEGKKGMMQKLKEKVENPKLSVHHPHGH